MAAQKGKHEFEDFADFDVDGAAVQVGLEHHVYGPASPFIRVNTGAVEVLIRAHAQDFDVLIDGLKAARRKLRKLSPA